MELPVLDSCTREEVIRAIEYCIDNKIGLNTEGPKEWLRFLKHKVGKTDNEIKLDVLNVARAGRYYNKERYEKDNIHDFIGTNFPGWKNASGYRAYPEDFDSPEQNVDILNKLLNTSKDFCFNQELLEQCRKHCPAIEETIKKYGGRLVYPDLQLVKRSRIHRPLSPITNKTTKVVHHRGFQTRVDEDYDTKTVEDITEDIVNRNWDPNQQQAVFFVLPEEYKYLDVDLAVENGTHRWYGNEAAGEDDMIGWIIEIPIENIRKLATGALNRDLYTSNKIKNKDIAQSVVEEYERGESNFALELKIANEQDKSMVNDIIITELNEWYKPRTREINSIVSLILSQTGVVPEKKQFLEKDRKDFIKNSEPNWEKKTQNTWICTLSDDEEQYVIDGSDDTEMYYNLTFKILEEWLTTNRSMRIVFKNPKNQNITKENRDEMRQKIITRVNRNLKKIVQVHSKIVSGEVKMPSYASFPEFDDENGWQVVL